MEVIRKVVIIPHNKNKYGLEVYVCVYWGGGGGDIDSSDML